MKTTTVLLALGAAVVGVVLVKKFVFPAKKTAGTAVGNIVDGAKDLVDVFRAKAPPGVPPLGDSPFAGTRTLSDAQGFERRRFGLQPTTMRFADRAAAGVIRNSQFQTTRV